jgi:hypothetical protein
MVDSSLHYHVMLYVSKRFPVHHVGFTTISSVIQLSVKLKKGHI